jgi:hypothetical protein
MMRFVTLLVATPGRGASLAERVEQEAKGVALHLDGHGQVRCAFSLETQRSTFDAVLEVLQPDENDLGPTLAAFDGLAGRLGGDVDPTQSAAVVGTEHVIVEGMGAIQIHACLMRSPALTVEAFRTFWRTEFAPSAKDAPHMAGYRQVHADAAASKEAASRAGVRIDDFDGLAVEWFRSSKGLQEASAWSDQQFSRTNALEKFSVEGMMVSRNSVT